MRGESEITLCNPGVGKLQLRLSTSGVVQFSVCGRWLVFVSLWVDATL